MSSRPVYQLCAHWRYLVNAYEG